MPTVKFRGEDHEVEVDHDHGYECDTNAHVIEWHFAGLTPEQNDALALMITEEEEQSIFEQLVEWSRESAADIYD